MDLVSAESATAELALMAAAPITRYVITPQGRAITLTLRHVSGAVGRMGLTIHDQPDQRIPISDDAMTCAEPGCEMKVEVSPATSSRTLIVTCTGSVAMTVHLEAAAGPTPSK